MVSINEKQKLIEALGNLVFEYDSRGISFFREDYNDPKLKRLNPSKDFYDN